MKHKAYLLLLLLISQAAFSAGVCFYYNANTIYQHGLTAAITYLNVYAKDRYGYDMLIGWTQLPAGDAAAGCMPVNYDTTKYPSVRVEMGLRIFGNPIEFQNVASGTQFSVDEEGGIACYDDGGPDCEYQAPVFTRHNPPA